MDSQKVRTILIVAISLLVALYLGVASATAQFEAVMWVVGSTSLIVCLLLGRKVFLLIPLMTSLGLVLPLPGNLNSGQIAQGITLAFGVLLILSRRFQSRSGFGELECWVLLLTATVVQVYVRNPVGLNIFGAGSVGAKPYFIFFLSFLTAAFLSRWTVTCKDLHWWVRLSLAGAIMNFGLGVVASKIPTIGYFLAASFATDVGRGDPTPEGQAGRISFVRRLSSTLATWISSKVSPLWGCFHPLWLPLILLSMALAAYSGYRSQIGLVGLIFLLGIAYQGGFRGVLLAALGGVLGLTTLALVNAWFPLPPNIQRSLSFLPGTWEEHLIDDATASSDWRFEMWEDALFTDRWIENKLLGDGLGFTAAELSRMKAFESGGAMFRQGTSGLTLQQETMMINGNYHSGPVETVRTTGYVGLAVMLLAMVRVATHAHRLIRRCRGTEWEVPVLFIGLPLIAKPFVWTFIFGTFSGGATDIMLGAAVLRLVERNVPLLVPAVRSNPEAGPSAKDALPPATGRKSVAS